MDNLLSIENIQSCATGVAFNCDYVDVSGVEKTTPVDSYICWGFLPDELRQPIGSGKLGGVVKSSTRLRYLIKKSQAEQLSAYPPNLVQEWLSLMYSVGVAQWLDFAPRTLQEFAEKGVSISTNYPTRMIVGLLETYRALLYAPTYCTYVIKLWREYKISPGSSMILPKILNIPGLAIPNADAFSCSNDYLPRADLFSERHILSCLEISKLRPLTVDTQFTGVFSFFASGYKKKIDKSGLNKKYLASCFLSQKDRNIRNEDTDYGRLSKYPSEGIPASFLHDLASRFNLLYEQSH